MRMQVQIVLNRLKENVQQFVLNSHYIQTVIKNTRNAYIYVCTKYKLYVGIKQEIEMK